MSNTLKFDCWVHGVKENNKDGTNRQNVLSKCKVGDVITFKLGNIKEVNSAFEAWTVHGCIGNVILDSYTSNMSFIKYLQNKGNIYNASIIEIKIAPRGKISCKITYERDKMR